MPTDPPTANQTNAPVPLGQGHPNPQHVPPAQHHPQHQRYTQLQQPPLPQHQQPQPHPLQHPHQPQHVPQRQQHYAALSSARNVSAMSQQPPNLAQALQQPQQQQQSRQHQRGVVTQPAPQQQFYGPYSGMGFTAVPASYPIENNFVYPAGPPYPFNGIQPQPNAQQPGPQGARGQRQHYQSAIPPASQRQSSSRVSVPAPRKRIIAIVDPDTNEEVKVDNVDTKPASKAVPEAKASPNPVKIPVRTSRALELVSDPADNILDAENAGSKSEETSEKPKSVSATESVSSSQFSENKQVPPVSSSHSTTAVSLSTPPVSGNISTRNVTASTATKSTGAVPTAPPNPVTTKNSIAAASNTTDGYGFAPGPPDRNPEPSTTLGAGKIEEERAVQGAPVGRDTMHDSSTAKAVPADLAQASLDASKVFNSGKNHEGTETEYREEKVKVDDRSLNGVEVEASETTDATIPTERETVDTKDLGKKSVPSSADNGSTDESSDTIPKQQLIFKDGERRIYPPDFILSMRPSANPKKAAEFELVLSTNNIFKDGPASANPRMGGDPRGLRTVRPTAGSLSVDPRGKRAFPAQAAPGFMAPVRGPGPPGMVGSGGVGSYDAFDLRSARSQNPPPPPKGQQGMTRDPRLSRQGAGRDRFDGPTRQGHGPIDPFVNLAPVEKLKRSDQGWKRDRESDDEIQTKVKQIRSLLNKLTLEKFDKIFKQIIDINISSYEILTGVVKEVFEKALFEPKFSGMYAELCVRLDNATKDMLQRANVMDSSGKPIFFRNILLNNCKDEFTRFTVESDGANKTANTSAEKRDEKTAEGGTRTNDGKESSTEKPLTQEQKQVKAQREKEEADLIATKAKRRMLANVRFISELFLKGLLRETIIHRQCIQRLLAIGIEKKEEDVLEALCKLLSKTGAKLSANKEAVEHIDKYFKPLEVMARDHTLPARVRFMLQDLIEQRSNGWKLRREEVGAKTIAEIHKDIEKEERAKQEAQAASRERRGRGGAGMHHRDRGPQNFSPRVAMTMASRQKPTGNGMSRSAAMLEKHANRGSSNSPSAFHSVRLGPGGSRPNMTTGSTGTSLRPGGSRYNPLSIVSESRDSNIVNQSGDARRTGPKRVSGGPRRSATSKQDVVEEKETTMEPEKLMLVTKNVLDEYWSSISSITDTRQYLQTEVHPANYSKFIEEAIKLSVDAKMDQRERSVSLFCGIIDLPIPAELFVKAFSCVIGLLPDIELDNPKASEFLAKYIGATAATRKLAGDQRPSFGLEFVKSAIGTVSDHKKGAKVIVHVLSELYKNLTASFPDEGQRQVAVKNALNALDIDLSAKMSMWNPMNGASVLEQLLKDQGMMFILPTLRTELELKRVLNTDPSADEVFEVLTSTGLTTEDLRSELFMKMVIRVSFDWLFMDPPPSIKEKFSTVIGNALVRCLNSNIPSSVQMAALLAAQSFIVGNIHCLPPHREGNSDRPGHIAFESLYEADVVEEDAFLKWREDTGMSTSIEGKDRMLMQTTHFLNWLETAEVEE